MTEFYVKVRPDSSDFSIEEGHILTVYLENAAKRGRANAELVSRFSNILDSEVAIISGHKSSRKKLKTGLSEEEVEERIDDFLGDQLLEVRDCVHYYCSYGKHD